MQSDKLVVQFNFAQNGWTKRSKKREAKLRIKTFQILIFDAKLRFALFASLRSAIFSEINLDSLLPISYWSLSPQGLNKHNATQIVYKRLFNLLKAEFF